MTIITAQLTMIHWSTRSRALIIGWAFWLHAKCNKSLTSSFRYRECKRHAEIAIDSGCHFERMGANTRASFFASVWTSSARSANGWTFSTSNFSSSASNSCNTPSNQECLLGYLLTPETSNTPLSTSYLTENYTQNRTHLRYASLPQSI